MESKDILEKQKKFLIKFAYWAVWGIAGILLIKYVFPILLPFFSAFLLAWLLCKPIDFLARKIRIKRTIVAVVVVILFYVGIGGSIYYISVSLYRMIRNVFPVLAVFFTETVIPLLSRFLLWAEQMFYDTAEIAGTGQESAKFVAQAGEMFSSISSQMIAEFSNVAAKIPGICLKIMITMIAAIFMEVEIHSILAFIKAQIPQKWQQFLQRGKNHAMEKLGKCMLSYGLIILMTFGELFAGFLILGIQNAVVIAAVIAVLDILPVIGTGTVLVPWGIIVFAAGDNKLGAGLLALYLVITIVRNILEPKLVGQQMGLSPVVTLPCILIGLQFFGVIGVLVVPALAALIKELNDRDVIHLFRSEGDRNKQNNN